MSLKTRKIEFSDLLSENTKLSDLQTYKNASIGTLNVFLYKIIVARFLV